MRSIVAIIIVFAASYFLAYWALSYWDLEISQDRPSYSLPKAGMCKDAGGVWDLDGNTCNMSSVNEQ